MVRWANAASIWESMAFRARPSLPISVSGSEGSTRRVRSPAEMASASRVIDSSGSRPRRISSIMSTNKATTTAPETASSIFRREARVELTESSRVATTSVPPGSAEACNRYSGPVVDWEVTFTELLSGW